MENDRADNCIGDGRAMTEKRKVTKEYRRGYDEGRAAGYKEGYSHGAGDVLHSEWADVPWGEKANTLFRYRNRLARAHHDFIENMYARDRDIAPTPRQRIFLNGLYDQLMNKKSKEDDTWGPGLLGDPDDFD